LLVEVREPLDSWTDRDRWRNCHPWESKSNFYSSFIFYKNFFSKNCTSWCFSFVNNNTSQQYIPGFHGWMKLSIYSAWAEWSRTEIGKNRVIIFVI